MVKEFSSYWALILGGSSGLGLASAHKLAAYGMNICLVHRNTRVEMEQIGQQFDAIKAQGVQLLSFNVDVQQPEKRADVLTALKTAMGTEGRLRCLLHSIARGNLKALPELAPDDFNTTIGNMAVSLYDWSADALQRQLFANDARILSFTSDGSYKAMAHYAAVSAAKAALEAITRSMALEFAPTASGPIVSGPASPIRRPCGESPAAKHCWRTAGNAILLNGSPHRKTWPTWYTCSAKRKPPGSMARSYRLTEEHIFTST